MNASNTVEFTPASAETPWQLAAPLPTDIRAVVRSQEQPTVVQVGKALATFVGESIEAEEIEPPDSDIDWAMRVKVVGLPSDMLVWVEQLNQASCQASGVHDGWIIAAQTILHSGDPLTHFSNLLRLFAGSDLHVESICDIATGRWFPRDILDKLFVRDSAQPPEEVLWITRVVEAPEDSEPEERWAWVTTHGLARCGRVELEMLGVSAIVTSEAVHVIDGLAALTLESPLPAAGQVISIGPDILISLIHIDDAVAMLENQMPGSLTRTVPSVAITSPNGSSLYPIEALNAIRQGNTAVAKTARFTKKQAILARETWKLLLDAAEHGLGKHLKILLEKQSKSESKLESKTLSVLLQSLLLASLFNIPCT